jgi:hypothetical protein
VNGFVTVLICLAVWLRATSSATEQEVCETAIRDVLWVANQMIMQGAPKRASEDVEDVTSVKRSFFLFFWEGFFIDSYFEGVRLLKPFYNVEFLLQILIIAW